MGWLCLICVLFSGFAIALLLTLLLTEGWVVFAWCTLIMVPPLPIPWCMLIAYLIAPTVLAEYDGRALHLYGRRNAVISADAMLGATVIQYRGALSSAVVLLVTADRVRYKIKYAQDPSAVCRRLEKFAHVYNS